MRLCGCVVVVLGCQEGLEVLWQVDRVEWIGMPRFVLAVEMGVDTSRGEDEGK